MALPLPGRQARRGQIAIANFTMTSASLHRKLLKIAVSAIILAAVGAPLFVLRGGDLPRSLLGIVIFGLMLGSIEEFYIQAPRGDWIRRRHPLVTLLITFAIAIIAACASLLVNLLLWGELDHLRESLHQLFTHLPLLVILIALLVLILRVIAFIGGRNLIHLLTGRYHRPVMEKRVLAFIDIKDSTALVECLGALRGKEALSRIVALVSNAVTEHGGDVYLYTGDGLIASWTWRNATQGAAILHFARAALSTVDKDGPQFERRFGVTMPGIRIGIHGGDVVVSEQGDIRRAIGIWGDVINTAARLEQAGSQLGEDCLISQALLDAFETNGFELVSVLPIAAKGLQAPVKCAALHV
jgi:adenylate cyclase